MEHGKLKNKKKITKSSTFLAATFCERKKDSKKKNNPIPRNLSENRHAVQPSHLVIHPSEQLE